MIGRPGWAASKAAAEIQVSVHGRSDPAAWIVASVVVVSAWMLVVVLVVVGTVVVVVVVVVVVAVRRYVVPKHQYNLAIRANGRFIHAIASLLCCL